MCRFMCTLGGRSEVGEIGLEAAHATSELLDGHRYI